MHILSIITKVNPSSGGPIQGIRNRYSSFKNTGIKNDIVTFEESEDVMGWNFPETLKIHSLGKSYTPLAFNNKLFPFLVKNAINYDVLIIHGIWQYHSICTIKAIVWLKKNRPELKLPKVYCMPHGMLDPWFQKEKTRKLKAIRNYVYWYLLEKKVINEVDGILFTCEEELLLARTTFSGYNPKSEINVGYGIEAPPENNLNFSEAFTYLCPGINGEQFLLFLSRIDFKKGVDLLIEAYNLLSKKYPDLPHLVIAGPTDSFFAKEMILMADGNPKIHFTGMLRGPEKWGALFGCEAFILPSHQENFGIAVAEALACGKPVLISNKVNIYREIKEGGAGIINEDTLEGTISNLKHWIDLSSIEKQKMCEAAQQVYLKHFNVENAAKTLVEELKFSN
jgi:glycosyltransferase involved in cell wall biosynthesis